MDVPEVVELRIHGVSGTPPESLLDCPAVTQLAGDGRAGFYRPRLPQEQRDPRQLDIGERVAPGPRLEGYAWGGLTSGAATRAFWLLLLPFTFINVAPRLRPAGRGDDGSATRAVFALWYAARALALAMTALLVTAFSGVGLDLFAWQCRVDGSVAYGGPNCAKASPHWILGPLLDLSYEHRLLLGAALPLIVLVLLWQISERTINNYEAVPSPTDDDAAAHPDATEPVLNSRWMWRNEYMVRRLRHLHLQIGLTGVLWYLTAAMRWSWLGAVRIGIGGGVVAYIVVMLARPSYTGRCPRPYYKRINQVVWAVLAAWGVLVSALLIWAHPVRANRAYSGLPYYAGTAQVVFVVLVATYVAFFVVVCWLARQTPKDPPLSSWLTNRTAILIGTLGVFLGAVFSSGIYIYAAAWFSTGSIKPGFGEVSRAALSFEVPNVVRDAGRAYAVAVAFLLLTVVAALLAFVGNRVLRMVGVRQWPSRRYEDVLDLDYGTAAGTDPGRAKAVASMFWQARAVDYVHYVIAVLIAAGIVITGAFTVMLFGGGHLGALGQWHEHMSCQRNPACADEGVLWSGFLSAQKLQGTGGYLAVLTLILLVLLGAAAFRAPKTLRNVGILWDLASFWPRAAHPFAAPCYAERAVPDLVTRVVWYATPHPDREPAAGRPATGVVLAAHSQGTVLGAATLFQLQRYDETVGADEPSRRVVGRVAYLTFGCVLRRLYGRYFPAYFGPPAIARLQALLTVDGTSRVRNLWRHTDYLGGQLTSGPPQTGFSSTAGVPPTPDAPVDVQLIDPVFARPGGDTRYPAADRHSNFWRDPQFAPHVADLARMIPPPG
jgi:hypothetical protein